MSFSERLAAAHEANQAAASRKPEIKLPDDEVVQAVFHDAEFLNYEIRNGVRLSDVQREGLISAAADVATSLLPRLPGLWGFEGKKMTEHYHDAFDDIQTHIALTKAILLKIWAEIRPAPMQREASKITLNEEKLADSMADTLNHLLDENPYTSSAMAHVQNTVRVEKEEIQELLRDDSPGEYSISSPKEDMAALVECAQSVHAEIMQRISVADRAR